MKKFEHFNLLKPVLGRLYRLLTRRHKIYMGILLAMSVGLSLIETLGISVIMPFISLVSDTSLVNYGWYKRAFDFFGFESVEVFLINLGIAIIFFYIFRAVYSVTHLYFINRFSHGLSRYFSKKIFRITLSAPYKVYTQKNSAELMRTITNEAQDAGRLTLNILQLFSEFFTVLMIYTVIVILNWRMTIVITAILAVIVFFILYTLIRLNKIQGKKRLASGKAMNRSLKESLDNFKYVKLKGSEKDILRTYNFSIDTFTNSEAISSVLGSAPRTILESIGFSLLIAVIIFIIRVYDDVSAVIPVITMYALAFYRILPSVNRMLQNVNSIAYLQKMLESVDNSLRQPVETEGTEPVAFEHSIRLENVSFSYMTGNEILNGLNLEIKKGEKIAITGASGGGKSTLVDIIIGINKPAQGKVFIDGVELTDENICSWRKKIGYIPQDIYLFDGTVADNVAFGSQPDNERIKNVLKMANIWDFLEVREGLSTRVGDGGIQLSGGQLQRIAIARALYDDPQVLVLDEATSALDSQTEEKIMDEIYDNVSGNKTLIVIAHRLSTVERCGKKIKIENGRIVRTEVLG